MGSKRSCSSRGRARAPVLSPSPPAPGGRGSVHARHQHAPEVLPGERRGAAREEALGGVGRRVGGHPQRALVHRVERDLGGGGLALVIDDRDPDRHLAPRGALSPGASIVTVSGAASGRTVISVRPTRRSGPSRSRVRSGRPRPRPGQGERDEGVGDHRRRHREAEDVAPRGDPAHLAVEDALALHQEQRLGVGEGRLEGDLRGLPGVERRLLQGQRDRRPRPGRGSGGRPGRRRRPAARRCWCSACRRVS